VENPCFVHSKVEYSQLHHHPGTSSLYIRRDGRPRWISNIHRVLLSKTGLVITIIITIESGIFRLGISIDHQVGILIR
jgi:hypothetical protein